LTGGAAGFTLGSSMPRTPNAAEKIAFAFVARIPMR
jgi:hypothetical protein